MNGSLGMHQPGSVNSGVLGFQEPHAHDSGVLGIVQPGAFRSGSLGFEQPGSYNSGSLGRGAPSLFRQPGSYNSGSLGMAQADAYNSGSLGCGCGPKPMTGLGSSVRMGTLAPARAMRGLGNALGSLTLDLDLIVFTGLGAGAVWFLFNKAGK